MTYSAMTHPQINIVGAGLAGLVLARCLLRRGIASTVFERDTARSASTRYNYGITLHLWAYTPLLKRLDLDEKTFRRRLAVDAAIGGAGNLADGGADGSFRANRQRFEVMLREGLDIRWEHQLSDLTSDGSRNVLDFGNGEQTQAAIVVGADGPHSRVRRHLSPTTEFNVLPFAVYNGKRRLRRETFDAEYASYMHGANVVGGRDGQTLMQISINDRTDEIVSISYTYSRPARQGDPIFDPERPNSGAKDIPEALYDEIAALESLEGPFRDVFNNEKMRGDRLLNWLMRSISVPTDELTKAADRGVVLIGDAVHATPILGGFGANAAIEDGVELAEFIADNGAEDLASFCAQRHDSWWKYVEDSERQLQGMHSRRKANL